MFGPKICSNDRADNIALPHLQKLGGGGTDLVYQAEDIRPAWDSTSNFPQTRCDSVT
jgi:hypothetical protein